MNSKTVSVATTVEVPEERIEDVLCNYFEGGFHTDFRICEYIYPEGQTKQSMGIKYPYFELPMRGGVVVLDVPEDEDGKEYVLDKEACIKGLNLLASMYNGDFDDITKENDDFNTADIFIQLAVLGEIVYG